MTGITPLIPYRKTLGEYWRDFSKEVISLLLIIVLIVVGAIVNKGSADLTYLLVRIKVASFIGIIALIQATVVLSGGGGIDVSVGTMASMGALFGASIMQGRNDMLAPALLVVGASGLILGFVNGYMIARLRIHPLIQTLAMSFVITGIIVAYSQGRMLLGKPSPIVESLVNNKIGPVHNITIIWVVLAVGMELLLRRSRTGRKLIALGTNEKTALLSGMNVSSFKIGIYAFSGLCSSLFGTLVLGYVHTVYLDVGNQYLFPSVVACTIGGISLTGGAGSYVGALGGALVYIFLQSFLVTINMNEAWRKVIFGLILVIVLMVYSRNQRQK
jgi:ribose transport system permease protein